VYNFESDDRVMVRAKSVHVQIREDFLSNAFASRAICARFSSRHPRVVVPGGARDESRNRSRKIIISLERDESRKRRLSAHFSPKKPQKYNDFDTDDFETLFSTIPSFFKHYTENLIN